MKIVIVSGGNIEEDFALDFLKKNSYDGLIAADRGLEFCRRSGIAVDGIAGDFDSMPEETLACYEKQNILIRRLKPEKDDSDTQSALEMAMEMGAEECVLLGATGTRLDHVWANVQLLLFGELRGIRTCLVDAHNFVTVHRESFTLQREEQFGKYVSFYALGEGAPVITLEGFKYPLASHRLSARDGSLTVSNEIVGVQARVILEGGPLLMIQSRD